MRSCSPKSSAASGFFLDGNSAGASNTLVQGACTNQPAGGAFTHEGMLHNPMTFALAMDAMTNPGSGDVSRVNLATVCAQSLAPGLTDDDKKTTDATITTAGNNIVAYGVSPMAVLTEPPIASYAAVAG